MEGAGVCHLCRCGQGEVDWEDLKLWRYIDAKTFCLYMSFLKPKYIVLGLYLMHVEEIPYVLLWAVL